jgi:hypothetical protein
VVNIGVNGFDLRRALVEAWAGLEERGGMAVVLSNHEKHNDTK